VFATVIANDLKTLRCVRPQDRLFGTAFRAPLRCHHVSLVKDLLIFFAKNKDIFALNTRDLDIWHNITSKAAKLTVIEVILSHCKKFPLPRLRNFAIRPDRIYI
jgi:hypothetical protein